MVSIRAMYEDGKFVPLEPVELQNGQEVDITIVPKKSKNTAGRTPDLHPGSFMIGEDFDDPLPDSFWFGDDE